MKTSNKILRELGRLIHIQHWNTRIRFVSAVVLSKFRPIPAYQNLDQLLQGAKGGQHVVAFVIFCPTGMPQDTRALIESLHNQSELHLMVISKGPLTAEDRAFLGVLQIRYKEVRNSGFDLESYRDAVLTVLDSSIALSALTIMNDTSAILDTAKFVDNVLIAGRHGASQVVGYFMQGRKRATDRHLGSFCLTFDQSLLSNPHFEQFWRSYKPSNNRTYTIRLGEIGLSQMLLNAGVSWHALYDRAALVNRLESQDTHALNDLATALHASEVISLSEQERFQQIDDQEKIQLLTELIQNTENLRLLPLYSYLLGLPIVKRRNLRAYPKLAEWYASNLGVSF